MDATSVIAMIGGIALLIGIFGGGVKAKEVEIPLIPTSIRILAGATGIILLGIAIWLSIRSTVMSENTPQIALTSITTQNIPTQISTVAETTSAITATNTFVPTSTPTIVSTNTLAPTDIPMPNLESISGIWEGMDEGTVNGTPVSGREIELTLLADCSIGNKCGAASTLVDGSLCIKNLIWSGKKNETFIFEGIMKEGSASFCGEGGTITLTLMSNGTLSYTLESYNSSGSQVNKTATLNLR
jgi:hypothetical protein